MKHLRSIFLAITLLALLPLSVIALTPEEELSQARAECTDRALHMVREERDAYRRVQYGGGTEWSVLGTPTARTSDLVPYLVLNYHALSCRLRSICDAVAISHGILDPDTTLVPHRPLGCSRLFAARGRWWSDARRPQGIDPPVIDECNYRALADATESATISLSAFSAAGDCEVWVTQILLEERQMLRLLVSQDSAQRGTRQVVGVFQAVLRDVRDSFLSPLQSMVNLFGNVIHPIPCLLTQCN